MLWVKDHGGYVRDKVTLEGSFYINGTSTPDGIRDGNSNMIGSVARVSAGLFTVTFATVDEGGPTDLPEKLTSWNVNVSQKAGPTVFVNAYLVVDSYSQVTRSFQIQCLDLDTPAATDPDDNDTICFQLYGSICSTGTD